MAKKTITIDFVSEIEGEEFSPSLRAYMKTAFNAAVKQYALPYAASVTVTLVDEESIREYNKENRNIDSVTDVLSFPLQDFYEGEADFDAVSDAEFDEDGSLMLGDVVICLNVAKKQAEEYGHSLERETVYLFVHSILHLLGFDHMEDEEKARMRAAEEKIMTKIGLTRDE